MTAPTVPFYPITHDDGLSIVSALNGLVDVNDTPSLLADPFDEAISYAVGNYVIYAGALYRFTSSHSAGPWNSNHVTQIRAMDDKVSKNGDTMSGNLRIENGAERSYVIKRTDLGLGDDVSASTRFGYYLFKDKNEYNAGSVSAFYDTSKNNRIRISSANKTNGGIYSNYLDIGVNADGSPFVDMGSKSAWNNALDINKYVVIKNQDTETSIKSMYQDAPGEKTTIYFVNTSGLLTDYPAFMSAYNYYISITIKKYGSTAQIIIQGCTSGGTPGIGFATAVGSTIYYNNVAIESPRTGTFTKSTDGTTHIFGTPILKKSGRLVEFYCELNPTSAYTAGTSMTIGTIQDGFRPPDYRRIVPIEVNDGSGNTLAKSFGNAYIYTNGTVKISLKERGFSSFSAVYFV